MATKPAYAALKAGANRLMRVLQNSSIGDFGIYAGIDSAAL
jgi:hypothetical protein